MFLDIFDPGIIKFQDFPGFIKNKMIMLSYHVYTFKLCVIRSKLMLGYKSTVKQKFNGIV